MSIVLTLRGHTVSLCERPHLKKNIEGILESNTIELQIVGNPGITGGFAHFVPKRGISNTWGWKDWEYRSYGGLLIRGRTGRRRC